VDCTLCRRVEIQNIPLVLEALYSLTRRIGSLTAYDDFPSSLHCALAAAQCIVIGPVCLFVCVCVCLWVCYHDNSRLRASILTKLGGSDHLQLIKFWPSRAPGNGSAAGRNFWLCLTTASVQCLRLLQALFSFIYLFVIHQCM